jgi:hypothetical protein
LDTSTEDTESRSEHAKRSRFHRFVLAPLNIVLITVTVLVILGEGLSTVPETARANVRHQIEEIRSVDARSLFASFGKDIRSHTCNWQMECSVNTDATTNPVEPTTMGNPLVAAQRSGTDIDERQALERMQAREADRSVQRPVLPRIEHDLLGVPHALFATVRQIWLAGAWATGMILACTMFYAMFWLKFGRKPSDDGQSLLFMLLWLPAIVSLLVQLVQAIATVLFHGVHYILAEIVVLATYAGGIRLAAEMRDLWKSPHEIHEAVNVIRNV